MSGPLLDLGLVLDVLLEHREVRSADGEQAVRAAPKNRFPEVGSPMSGEVGGNVLLGERGWPC